MNQRLRELALSKILLEAAEHLDNPATFPDAIIIDLSEETNSLFSAGWVLRIVAAELRTKAFRRNEDET